MIYNKGVKFISFTPLVFMDKDLNISILNDIYGSLLTQNRREVIGSYYDCDLSLGEIAENCGISRQAVRDSVSKAKESLLDYEKKLGFKAKLDKIVKDLKLCLCEDDIGRLKKKLEEVINSI
jgi:hypothetical protein